MQEKRLSVTHNGFLEIFCEAPQHTLTQRILQTLEDHELVRKLIPEGQGSLMKAISDQLFFSSLNHQEIQDKCIEYARGLVASKQSIPNKLKRLKTIFEQYKQEPSNLMFDTINLELVSVIYNVRIVVYSMSKELVLKSLLFNNRCSKTIQIINMSNHYDSIYSEQDLNKHALCQNILYEILNGADLNLGLKVEPNLINIDYENYLEDITRTSPDQEDDEITQEFRRKHKRSLSDTFNQLQQLQDAQANNQAGYSLFDNNMPPELFNVILDKERRNSIVEYVRHKKSTICNSANQTSQNQPSPLNKEGESSQTLPVTQPKPPKKGVGVSLNAVKNRIVGSTDSDRSSDSEDDDDQSNSNLLPKPIVMTKVESVISQNSNSNGVQINIIQDNQDEEYNLIKETTDFKRSRQESAASYNGGNMSNSSLSNHASFQAFSAQNLTLPSQQMKHCSSNPLIQFPNSRPHSPSNNTDSTAALFNSSHSNKIGGQYQSQQNNLSQQGSTSSQSQHLHAQGIYSMTDLQANANNQLQQPNAPHTNYSSNTSSPPPGVVDPNSGNFLNPLSQAKRKHQVIESSKEKFKGTLKFFDQDKNYGFIVEDDSRSDIFVHFDDLQKAGIHKGCLIDHKHSKQIRFQFSMMDYIGKYHHSRKAVELQLLSDTPPYMPINATQLRVLPPEQYLNTYPNYYAPPQGPVIHSPTSSAQQEIGGTQNYFSSPYASNYINHQTLMPPQANHMIPMQPPLSPTGQQTATFPPTVMHFGMNVPQQQVVPPQYANVQVQQPPSLGIHHPPSPQMHQAPYPGQQQPPQAQQQLYYNSQQQPQQQAPQLPYQNLVI